MLSTAELQAIARQVKTTQDQGLEMVQITSKYTGFDSAAAYAVADLVHARRLGAWAAEGTSAAN